MKSKISFIFRSALILMLLVFSLKPSISNAFPKSSGGPSPLAMAVNQTLKVSPSWFDSYRCSFFRGEQNQGPRMDLGWVASASVPVGSFFVSSSRSFEGCSALPSAFSSAPLPLRI